MLLDGNIFMINPVHSILAFTSHKDQYFPLSKDELPKCHEIPHRTFLCHNIQATYSPNPDSSTCEVLAFFNESTLKCQWATVSGNLSFVQTFYNNRWIFATTQPQRMSGVCEQNTVTISLNGVGIIDLEPGCTIKTNSMSIRVHGTKGTSSIHQPHQFTVFAPVNSTRIKQSPIVLNSNPYETNIDTAESIHHAIAQLKTREREFTIPHHSVISYTSLSLSVLMIMGLLVIIIRTARKQFPVPTLRTLPVTHNFSVPSI